MTDYGTIKIPADAHERHNKRRKRMGKTWEAYIDGESPAGVDHDAIADAVAERVDGIDSFAEIFVQLDRIEDDTDTLAEEARAQDTPDTVSLDASERRRIAEEVAEVLQR